MSNNPYAEPPVTVYVSTVPTSTSLACSTVALDTTEVQSAISPNDTANVSADHVGA